MHTLDQVQAIHTDDTRYVLTSQVNTAGTNRWTVCLFAEDDGLVAWTWAGQRPDDHIGEAIKGGYLAVKETDNGRRVEIHPPSHEMLVLDLTKDDASQYSHLLLNAVFTFFDRPLGDRNLRVELTQKEDEIAHLNARLASARATVARVDKKKTPISPQKKIPNASGLQPNQKRRKAVEDEFAGSDDED